MNFLACPHRKPPEWLSFGLFSFLLLAVVANGLYFWLLKCQIIESNAYAEYLSLLRERAYGQLEDPAGSLLEGFYISPGNWIFAKFLKDAFVLVFFITSLVYLRHYLSLNSRSLALPALFGISVLISAGYSFLDYGPWVTALGVRPIFYLLAGAIGFWMTDKWHFEWLSRCLLAILAIELAMCIYEAVNGLALFTSSRLGNRTTGTFSFPTSLGVFAVFAFAFVSAHSAISKTALLALVVPLVYLSGSATALVLLLLAIAFWLWTTAQPLIKRFIPLATASILMAVLLTLPYLVERDDIYESLWGRIEPFEDYLTHHPSGYALLFGKGIGIGSNVLTTMVSRSKENSQTDIKTPDASTLQHARTDSTPLALLNQFGILGTLFFYLTLLFAALNDRRSTPIYLILVVAGMAINIMEFFPINFLLGLLLSRSLWLQSKPVGFQ